MSQSRSLPKLVIFGDPAKGPVAEAIEESSRFLGDKARIVASCYIEKCTIDVLSRSDFALVFGGDGSIISAARDLSQANVPVIGVNLGKLGFLAEFSVSARSSLTILSPAKHPSKGGCCWAVAFRRLWTERVRCSVLRPSTRCSSRLVPLTA